MWRYSDFSDMVPKFVAYLAVVRLMALRMGTEAMLEIWPAAGLIKIYSDTVIDDPLGRPYKCRIIQCANVVAGLQRLACGKVTGAAVRHERHPITLAGILEAGGPKGSSYPSAHGFTIPGVYCCLESELSPFAYATRGRITLSMVEKRNQRMTRCGP